MAYYGRLNIDGMIYMVGSSLYGSSGTSASSQTKYVSALNDIFDQLIPGITVHIQFTQGNTQETIVLKVGSTDALPVHGNAKCSAGQVLAFTYGTVNGTDAWILNAGEKTAVSVMQHYDSTSTEPISGKGVAEAIAPLTGGSSAAALGVDTTIGANPTNDKVPTSAAVADYVANQFDAQNILIYKGLIGSGSLLSNVPSSDYSAGWTYKVNSKGTYAGVACDIGDLVIAISDATVNQVSVNNNHWIVVQSKLVNPVSGPSTATQGHIATFGSDSQHIVDSGYTIETSVPPSAVFTDTKYEDKGTIQAVTQVGTGNDIIIASTSSGRLHLLGGLSITKDTASTGIKEAT